MHKHFFSYLLTILCFSSSLFADEFSIANDAKAKSAYQYERNDNNSESCYEMGPGYRFDLRHREPESYGYTEGFTTLAAFLSPCGEMTTHPFVDLRGHVFNDGRFAANAGGGVRVKSYDGDIVYGLNAYYDYREVKQLSSQHQAGMGVELLSKWLDFRMNGYIPFGKKTAVDCPCFKKFCHNDAIANQDVRGSLASLDFEFGIPVNDYVDILDVYIGLGAYYLFKRDICREQLGDEWGVKLRFFFIPYDGIALGGQISYDPIFKTNAQAGISFSYPFSPWNLRDDGERYKKRYPGNCEKRAKVYSRMTQPVMRNEIIPVENKTTCFPFNNCRILFVDNCRTEGCGKFESPFNSLIAAEEASCVNEIIYVFPGDGTAKNMDAGFITKEGQRLLSSAVCFDLCGICVPAHTPGCMPFITNIERTITTNNRNLFFGAIMNDCTEVSGFRMDFSVSEPSPFPTLPFGPENSVGIFLQDGNCYKIKNNCITNAQVGIANDQEINNGCIEITDNIIENTAGEGICFFSDISNSKICISSNTLTTTTGGGIDFDGNISDSCIRVANNKIADLDNPAINFNNTISKSDLILKNNKVTNAVNAIIFNSSVSDSQIKVANNQIENTTNPSFTFFGPLSSSSIGVFCNRFTGANMQNFIASSLNGDNTICMESNQFNNDIFIQNLAGTSCWRLVSNTMNPSSGEYDSTVVGGTLNIERLSILDQINCGGDFTGVNGTEVNDGDCGCSNLFCK